MAHAAKNQWHLRIHTRTQGLHLITPEIEALLRDLPSGPGLLHIFLQHTSASLLIQENADPTARQDLEEYINRLAPEGQGWHRHLAEGPDDTVSHLKSAITPSSLTIPMFDGKMLLGTWQGIYLWEHRHAAHNRNIILTFIS